MLAPNVSTNLIGCLTPHISYSAVRDRMFPSDYNNDTYDLKFLSSTILNVTHLVQARWLSADCPAKWSPQYSSKSKVNLSNPTK